MSDTMTMVQTRARTGRITHLVRENNPRSGELMTGTAVRDE